MKNAFTVDSSLISHTGCMASLRSRLIRGSSSPANIDERGDISHLLRRTSFGPFPGQVESLANRGYAAVLDAVLSAPVAVVVQPQLDATDQQEALRVWWFERMRSVTANDPTAGLHERAVLFWHGHFTSGFDKVDDAAVMWTQHALIRGHALGNFRDFVRAVTKDAAMLRYLDGDGSSGDAPNENYSRELMELFALGRGNYTETDVRAGAKALSGWYVDDAGVGRFDESSHFDGMVTYLGRSGTLSADDVVDAVCDHRACAGFIVGKLHSHFVGEAPSDKRRAELAEIFRSEKLELRPVVDAILRHDTFRRARYNRPRLPVELVVATSAVLALDGVAARDLYRSAADLGQELFDPPNVAGWPGGQRWINTGNTIMRCGQAVDLCFRDDTRLTSSTVDEVLLRCGIFEPTKATRAGLLAVASRVPDDRERAAVLLALALSSPEFALA